MSEPTSFDHWDERERYIRASLAFIIGTRWARGMAGYPSARDILARIRRATFQDLTAKELDVVLARMRDDYGDDRLGQWALLHIRKPGEALH